jgi:hypothetical protein
MVAASSSASRRSLSIARRAQLHHRMSDDDPFTFTSPRGNSSSVPDNRVILSVDCTDNPDYLVTDNFII